MDKFFSTALHVNRLKCLRNDCTYNDCKICVNFCPYGALSLDTGKLLLIDEKCTNCTACIGVCPTEAIGADGFEPNVYMLNEFAKEGDTLKSKTLDDKLTVKCAQIGSCLSSFDEQHLVTLVMRSSRDIEIDMSDCVNCPLNEKSCVTVDRISRVANETNRFLKAIGFKKELLVKKTVSTDRRGFLKSLFSGASSISEAISFEKPENKGKIPLKTVLLKNTLRDSADELNYKITEDGFSFLTTKLISDNCTNCRACVEFCPTNALFYSSDYAKIYFQSGKCVDCSICDSVCKDNALSKGYELDIVRFMFDKAVCAIEHHIIECDHCKIGFSSKNGDTTCNTCKLFKTDFATMFMTAEEVENASKS
jgi:energy-converting hydrogenase A subunit P